MRPYQRLKTDPLINYCNRFGACPQAKPKFLRSHGSAYAGDSNQQKALAAGFQQHLPKPVAPEDLVKAIATLMDETDGGD